MTEIDQQILAEIDRLAQAAVGKQSQGAFEEAIGLYRQALEMESGLSAVHLNLGVCLKALERLPEAAEAFERALELEPDYAGAYFNLANVLVLQERNDKAETCFRRALEQQTVYPEALNNLANLLLNENRLQEAAEACEQALGQRPDFLDALNTLGNVRKKQGRFEEACELYRRVLLQGPESYETQLNLGMGLLLLGDFQEGGRLYEQRLPKAARAHQPWPEGAVKGKRVVILAEQGYGDAIQGIRYAPVMKAAGAAAVHVECEKPLMRLFAGLDSVSTVVETQADLPPHDLRGAVLSLPYLMGTRLDTIPAETPYITADPDLTETWAKRFSGLQGLKAGLVWSGNPNHKNDHNRSIPLDQLAPLAEVGGIDWVSLQMGVESGDLNHWPAALNDPTSDITDFADSAAILANLDLVIAADTAVVHLAGALGRPVWVLLPFDPDWRWLLERTDSPWYPTAQLFRQSEPGDWAGVVRQVKAALPEEIKSHRS